MVVFVIEKKLSSSENYIVASLKMHSGVYKTSFAISVSQKCRKCTVKKTRYM